MVSPLQSIAANLRPAQDPLMQVGDILSRGRQVNSGLQTQQLQRQNMQQQMNQRQQAMTSEQSLGAARYLNSLGKQLLSVDESQWPQILGPNLPQLQQLGYTPEVLQGMTREQVQGVVAQTEPLMDDGGRLSLERDKLRQRELEREQRQRQFESKQGELKPGVQKILAQAQDAAIESGARARQLAFLASDLEGAGDIGAGARAGFNEFLKERLGTQDDVSELRRRFNAIRSSEAVQNLPPGVASDKDIELALKGFPAETANKQQLISFLRGAEKLAKFQESYNRVKSELISEKGSTRGLLAEVRERLPDIIESEQPQRVIEVDF